MPKIPDDILFDPNGVRFGAINDYWGSLSIHQAQALARKIDATWPCIHPTHPLPMLLWCPFCSKRHIDEGKFETHPHHTHACQSCGGVWRPAIFNTVGVQFLPGFKNNTIEPTNEVVIRPIGWREAPPGSAILKASIGDTLTTPDGEYKCVDITPEQGSVRLSGQAAEDYGLGQCSECNEPAIVSRNGTRFCKQHDPGRGLVL